MDKMIQIKNKLNEYNKDGILIFSPVNRRYFTKLKTSWGVVLITKDKNYFITDFRYKLEGKELSKREDFIFTESNPHDLYNTLNKIIKDLNLKDLMIEYNYISHAHYLELKEKLNINLSKDFNIIENIRKIKTEDEIKLIKKSQEIAEKSLLNTMDIIKPGLSEKECASYLHYEILKNGSESGEFGIIFASGENSAKPHAIPGDRIIKDGDFILIDFGAIYSGYYSDISRTFSVGKPSKKMEEVYEIVLQANIKGIDFLKAGKTGKEVDSISRDIIKKAGYGDNFGHNLGHGLGLEIHEDPRLGTNNNEKLEVNNLVTIEPGIYLANEFGIRIEDLLVIKEDGNINLTKMSKELTII